MDQTIVLSINEQATIIQGNKAVTDPSHMFNSESQLLPSGRRLRVSYCRINTENLIFIPVSRNLINSNTDENGSFLNDILQFAVVVVVVVVLMDFCTTLSC